MSNIRKTYEHGVYQIIWDVGDGKIHGKVFFVLAEAKKEAESIARITGHNVNVMKLLGSAKPNKKYVPWV